MAFVSPAAKALQAPRRHAPRRAACSVRMDANASKGVSAAANDSRRSVLQALSLGAAGAALGVLCGADRADAIVPVEPGAPPMKFKTTTTFVKDESGVRYMDVKTGVGASPQNGDFVVVDWVAYLSDGTVFDNTTSPGRNPVVFQMGQRKVIPGIEIALKTMKQSGVRKVIIPPDLAYGRRGVCIPEQGCLVPPGETLEYDLTLKRVAVPPI